MNMLNSIVFNRKRIVKFFLILCLLSSITHSQADRIIQMKVGDLITYVDMYRANFSIFDSIQSNIELASFLFGNTTIPSSFFEIYIDGKKQMIDNMAIEYPLGLSLDSQIDGIYLAGDNKDIRVEFAFFPLDLLGNNDVNSVSLAISVSNLSSFQARKIAIRILLDPDIGESRNNPLVYLPTGDQITNGHILGDNQIPLFLFFGQKTIAETRPIGQGFYLYPFITERLPDQIILGNWKKISTSSIHDTNNIENSSLAYDSRSNKDLGISLVFGDFMLNPQKVDNIGIIISKNLSTLWPVVEEEVLTKGVFNTNRFEAEEILEKTHPLNMDNFLKQEIIQKYIPAVQKLERSQKRSEYRKNILGILSNRVNYDYPPSSNKYNSSNISQQFSDHLRGNDDSWKYIYQLNQEIKYKEQFIDEVLKLQFPSNTYYTPPYQGIQKDQFYSE